MINLVLNEIKNSREPFSLAALSEKLYIDQPALEGMITFCVHKGWLLENGCKMDTPGMACATGGCSSCEGIDQCTFVAKMPKTYTYTVRPGQQKFSAYNTFTELDTLEKPDCR